MNVAAPSPEILQLLVKGATEYALILMNPSHRITYWNKGAEKIFGYSESEILGESILKIFTAQDTELGVSQKEMAKAEQCGWADDERWHCKKDGSLFWANGVVTCLKDESGKVIGFSKVLRDQTLRKKTEDELKSAVNELTQFSHIASHDLQEPLRMVSNYLSLIEKKFKGQVSSELDEYLDHAGEGAKRMRAMLSDLLSFAGIQGNKSEAVVTDSAAVWDTAVSNLKLVIDESGAHVTRATLPTIHAVPSLLARLFQNLISNGIKYCKKDEPPKIVIDAKKDKDEWIFSVSDNGIGIDPKNKDTIFQAFKRLHSREEYPGTGLGLFICKRIVERHGGKIWIDSTPQQGTSVSFTWPSK